MIRIATFAAMALVTLNLTGTVQPGWTKGWNVQGVLTTKANSLNTAIAARTAMLDALTPREAATPRR